MTSDFFHYTDDQGAQNIIRSGRILSSLGHMATTDDAVYGNGVYLTKLTPETCTKAEIAWNNWVNASASFINKTKNYFVFKIPDSHVRAATYEGRSIFLYGRRSDLSLYKYRWWLKNYDSGQIIASYKYQVVSFGPASLLPDLSSKMGVYTISDETVNGRPVYEHDGSGRYLFMTSYGMWCVGGDPGEDEGWFSQMSNFSLGPELYVPWDYTTGPAQWKGDDATLRAFAWQM